MRRALRWLGTPTAALALAGIFVTPGAESAAGGSWNGRWEVTWDGPGVAANNVVGTFTLEGVPEAQARAEMAAAPWSENLLYNPRCAAPFYRGTYDYRGGGKAWACTGATDGTGGTQVLEGVFRDSRVGPLDGGTFQMVGPSGSAFDGHGPGGALEQVDGPWRGRCLEGACAAPAEQLLSGNVRIILKNRDFHPKKIRVRSGTTLTICSRDPFFHKLFSYSRYNRFGVRKGIPIRTGGCLKVKVVNPTAAPLPVVISDEIHSFERLRVNVLPAGGARTGGDGPDHHAGAGGGRRHRDHPAERGGLWDRVVADLRVRQRRELAGLGAGDREHLRDGDLDDRRA